MYSIDKQGRLNIPNGLLDLSLGTTVQKVVFVEADGCDKYQIVPLERISPEDKIMTGTMNLDSKKRIFIPKLFRNEYSNSVALYVQRGKLYIEFKK